MGVKANKSERLLQLKGNVFWFRQGVPKKVWAVIGGPKWLSINLNTGTVAEAKAMRDQIAASTRVQFAEIVRGRRASLDLPFTTLSGGSVSSAARERGTITREAILAAEAADDAEAMYLIVEAAEAEALSLPPSQRQAFENAMLGRVRVDHFIEGYAKTAKVTDKTMRERRGLIRRFADWAAENRQTLDRIDRRIAGRYVSETLEEMHPATQRKHLTALGQYWKHLASKGHVNLPLGEPLHSGWPWHSHVPEQRSTKVSRRGRADRERPFVNDEVATLLYEPFPINAGWEVFMKDVLRTSLLSGMRQAEVLSLWANDVVLHHGVLCFDLKEAKTEAGARKVPVHSELVGMIERRLEGKADDAVIFDEMADKPNPADAYGKRFNRWRKALGVDDQRPNTRRSLVNFHSARRWFATQARHAGQPRETIADVMGHKLEKRDLTFSIYTPGASERQMQACVEAVKLPSSR